MKKTDKKDSAVGVGRGPSITKFTPVVAYPGSIIEIKGTGFGPLRENNVVSIGGVKARVIEASKTYLKVISSYKTKSGKIKVTVGAVAALSAVNFKLKEYPTPGSAEDGPPILLEGTGTPSSGDVPPTGNLNVLVVLVNPTDVVPANPVNSRTDVVNKWNSVTTFYNQASYNTLHVVPTITNTWHTLYGNLNDYVDIAGINNIRKEMLNRLMAECAQHAVNDGFNLDNYQMISCVIFLNGTFIRAWGGSSNNHFVFFDAALGANINLSSTNQINQLWIQESANWGRFAHETGHNIVSVPTSISGLSEYGSKALGEDIYKSDLADGSIATAASFDMMGSHDTHPVFSAYHLEKAGWVNGTNILNLNWDRNPFSGTYDLVAHGLAQNAFAGRYHIVKIKVTDGLFYNIEVRQRPPAGSAQVFDDQIPLDVAAHNGGVIVTKVFTDVVNNNQQTRFISLLHDEHVLSLNQIAIDPARALKITVLNDNIAANPLVCRVKVEWAQTISNDPAGQFDLRIDPWDGNYQTPDIWIDRNPFGAFDQSLDAQGRPRGNGDKPRPQEINHFYTRVHNDGVIPVSNVNVTFYAISPPGVGDNGNWAPITTRVIANINQNDKSDIFANWVPAVGQHTCLKIFIQPQLGEISGGNNSAQENVFEFEAPAASVPEAVYIPVAVRNPLKERTIVHLSVNGVKYGYVAQFPNAWVWLDALEERNLILTVVPILDYPVYKRNEKTTDYATNINLTGYVPREYQEEIKITKFPASKLLKIGGIYSKVKPKKKATLKIWQEINEKDKMTIVVCGKLSELIANQNIRVDISSPIMETMYVGAKTDAAGSFMVRINFNPIFKKLLAAKKVQDQKDFAMRIKAVVQAFVISASDVAETSSNSIDLVF